MRSSSRATAQKDYAVHSRVLSTPSSSRGEQAIAVKFFRVLFAEPQLPAYFDKSILDIIIGIIQDESLSHGVRIDGMSALNRLLRGECSSIKGYLISKGVLQVFEQCIGATNTEEERRSVKGPKIKDHHVSVQIKLSKTDSDWVHSDYAESAVFLSVALTVYPRFIDESADRFTPEDLGRQLSLCYLIVGNRGKFWVPNSPATTLLRGLVKILRRFGEVMFRPVWRLLSRLSDIHSYPILLHDWYDAMIDAPYLVDILINLMSSGGSTAKRTFHLIFHILERGSIDHQSRLLSFPGMVTIFVEVAISSNHRTTEALRFLGRIRTLPNDAFVSIFFPLLSNNVHIIRWEALWALFNRLRFLLEQREPLVDYLGYGILEKISRWACARNMSDIYAMILRQVFGQVLTIHPQYWISVERAGRAEPPLSLTIPPNVMVRRPGEYVFEEEEDDEV